MTRLRDVRVVLFLFSACWPSCDAGFTGDRLVVAEEIQRLTMSHTEFFEQSKTFLVSGSSLIVPAQYEAFMGLWTLAKFAAKYRGGAKTACEWSVQANYYLPGNNRYVKVGKTVLECKDLCCKDTHCVSFDYEISKKTCWLSDFKESAAGLTFKESAAGLTYAYYELNPTEAMSELAMLESKQTPPTRVLVGSGKHTPYLFMFSYTAGSATIAPTLAPLGKYSGAGATAGHEKPILTLQVLTWPDGQRLISGSFDQTVRVWTFTAGVLSVAHKISGFTWPIWAATGAETSAKGLFIAGDHTDISHWVPASGTGVWTKKTKVLKGHSRLVRCLAYESSQSMLASGSEDKVVVLWHLKAGTTDFEFGARLFDHTAAVTSVSFATLTTRPLLLTSGDDGNVMVFNPKADGQTACAWEKQMNYYLPGNNRYEFADSTLEECSKICCESHWCASFDYATKADPGGLHGANACWLSTNIESAAGLQWDSSGTYDYYEVAKRGTQMLRIQQPGPVSKMSFSPAPVNMMAVEHSGDASNPGGLIFMKLQEVTCQDGHAPNYAATDCVACPLGYAGKNGVCDQCLVGHYSPKEGLFACEPCPAGYASSITETPSDKLLPDLIGLRKCTACPKWALMTKTGQTFCEWCPPGEVPNGDRAACVGPKKGSNSVSGKTDWTQSWYSDGEEKQDRFCPLAATPGADQCRWGSAAVAASTCPMTCPKNYQVEVNNDWNPVGVRSGLSGFTTNADVSWKCLIKDKNVQEKCNKLLCMGSIVSMQGGQTKAGCTPDGTDCTCEEDLREACKGGVKRLQEEQCSAQCSARWCELMCQQARAKEYTGIFTPHNVENPFTVKSCLQSGIHCTATCENVQRRVSVRRICGEFDIWDEGNKKFLIPNDALCGTEAEVTIHTGRSCDYSGNGGGGCTTYTYEKVGAARIAEDMCMNGNMGKVGKPHVTNNHETFRPSSCTSGAVSQKGSATILYLWAALMAKRLFA